MAAKALLPLHMSFSMSLQAAAGRGVGTRDLTLQGVLSREGALIIRQTVARQEARAWQRPTGIGRSNTKARHMKQGLCHVSITKD